MPWQRQHPNFFAFFPCPVSYPSILGEMYSAAFSAAAFNWICSPACTELETIVLDVSLLLPDPTLLLYLSPPQIQLFEVIFDHSIAVAGQAPRAPRVLPLDRPHVRRRRDPGYGLGSHAPHDGGRRRQIPPDRGSRGIRPFAPRNRPRGRPRRPTRQVGCSGRRLRPLGHQEGGADPGTAVPRRPRVGRDGLRLEGTGAGCRDPGVPVPGAGALLLDDDTGNDGHVRRGRLCVHRSRAEGSGPGDMGPRYDFFSHLFFPLSPARPAPPNP